MESNHKLNRLTFMRMIFFFFVKFNVRCFQYWLYRIIHFYFFSLFTVSFSLNEVERERETEKMRKKEKPTHFDKKYCLNDSFSFPFDVDEALFFLSFYIENMVHLSVFNLDFALECLLLIFHIWKQMFIFFMQCSCLCSCSPLT